MLVGRNLEDFTIEEVGELLDSLHFSEYKNNFLKKEITGKVLTFVETADELIQFGIVSKEDQRKFFGEITELKHISGKNIHGKK